MSSSTGIGRRSVGRRQAIAVLAAGLGGAGVAVACGRGTGTGSPNAGQTAAAAQPKTGGSLTAQIPADFWDFDMSIAGRSTPNSYAVDPIYESLLSVKIAPDIPYDQQTIVPSLAEKWEVSADATTFTFHLRQGVHFANIPPVNGRALTSADVKWSYEYYGRSGAFKDKQPAGLFAYMFDGLDSIQAPDPSTVIVKFSQPYAPFLNYNYTDALSIAPHEVYDVDGSLTKRAVGSGPFQLDLSSSQHGSRWLLKKNESYWQQGRPYLDQLSYRVINDDSTVYAAFQTQQLDVIKVAKARDVDTVAKSSPAATAQITRTPSPTSLRFMVKKAPLDDVRVRRAISLALDRDEFDKTLTEGRGGWAMSGSFPDSFTQDEIKQILKTDPQQSRQLLSAAGYGNGLTIPLMLKASDDIIGPQLLQAQLKQVGINVVFDRVDDATGSTRLHASQFTMYIVGEAAYADLDAWLFGGMYSASAFNWAGVNDPKMDELVLAQRREADPAKRRQLLKDASTYIAENAFSLALYRPVGTTFSWPYLKNYADHWLKADFNGPNIWLDK